MSKLIVTCICGQESRVSASAMGKTGMCPACRRKLRIAEDNTRPADGAIHAEPEKSSAWQQWRGPSAKAIERFARAVDCFNEGRYAEALAILDGLAQQYPGNAEIHLARQQCVSALRRARLPGPDEIEASLRNRELDPEAVKRVVLEKMLHGKNDADRVQLDAARLAAEILGMIPVRRPRPPRDAGAPSGNGHGHVHPAEGEAPGPERVEDATEDPAPDAL